MYNPQVTVRITGSGSLEEVIASLKLEIAHLEHEETRDEIRRLFFNEDDYESEDATLMYTIEEGNNNEE